MEQNKKLSLKEEMENEARKIEEEIANNPDLEGIEVSDRLEASILAAIQAYEKEHKNVHNTGSTDERSLEKLSEEPAPNFSAHTNDGKIINLSEEDMEALRLGRELLKKQSTEGEREMWEVNKEYHKHLNNEDGGKHYRKLHMPKKKKLTVALVAVCVLVLATGMTSMGSKSYWKELLDGMLGNQSTQKLNVKDMEVKETEDGDELTAYREISEELGIPAVRIGSKPKDMYLEKYSIDKQQGRAHLFYQYNDEVIRYSIYLNDSDSSLQQKKEDEYNSNFEVSTAKQKITVNSYKVKGYEEYRYMTSFNYHGVYYQIKGIMREEEIRDIVKNLIYLD